MKDLKHTPGPWKFSTETHFNGGAPYSESVYVTMGENTLTIGCHTGAPNQEALKANASLIAAAPDLLEALQDLTELMQGMVADDVLLPAITAIKKATEL